MAQLNKYSGDRDPIREAQSIESRQMNQEFRAAAQRGNVKRGLADPGIQAMKRQAASPTVGPHWSRRVGGQEQLRGNTEALQSRPPDATRAAEYGTRVDGNPKGPGYFGEVFTEDPEFFGVELTTTIQRDGKPFHFPLLVPTLTREEIAHLVDGGQPTLSIAKKARLHALERAKAGKSPFAEEGEQVPLPASEKTQMQEGFDGPQSVAPDMTNSFNTPLTSTEEKKFQEWVKENHLTKTYQPQLQSQEQYEGIGGLAYYDLRGAFKAGVVIDERGHLPDTWKKPNHPTFSDESIYSGPSTQQGGHWAGEDTSGQGNDQWDFQTHPDNLKHWSSEQLKRYFKYNEHGSKLTIRNHLNDPS